MTEYSLSLRPRALAEIEAARDGYERVGHGESFVLELETVIGAIQAMPLRFPIVVATIHRALTPVILDRDAVGDGSAACYRSTT